jgi:hypothetical protein
VTTDYVADVSSTRLVSHETQDTHGELREALHVLPSFTRVVINDSLSAMGLCTACPDPEDDLAPRPVESVAQVCHRIVREPLWGQVSGRTAYYVEPVCARHLPGVVRSELRRPASTVWVEIPAAVTR